MVEHSVGHQYLEAFPHGLDSLVGELKMNGQHQKEPETASEQNRLSYQIPSKKNTVSQYNIIQ